MNSCGPTSSPAPTVKHGVHRMRAPPHKKARRAHKGLPAQISSQDEIPARRPEAAPEAPLLLPIGYQSAAAPFFRPWECGVRVGSARRRKEASPSAQRPPRASFWQCQNGQIVGLWRPPRRRRWSQSVPAQPPDASGTQGTRGPHTRPLSRLAECRAPLRSIVLATPERPDSGPVAAPDGPSLLPIGVSAPLR